MSTEYRRIKYFTKSGQYVAPRSYIIGYSTKQRANKTGQFISLRQMLQLFLKIPNALNDILSYMNSLNYTD